MKCPFRE